MTNDCCTAKHEPCDGDTCMYIHAGSYSSYVYCAACTKEHREEGCLIKSCENKLFVTPKDTHCHQCGEEIP